MAPPPAVNVDLVLQDIRAFKGRGRLRPTKTVDKSKPVLIAEGEKIHKYEPQQQENTSAMQQRIAAPPAVSNGIPPPPASPVARTLSINGNSPSPPRAPPPPQQNNNNNTSTYTAKYHSGPSLLGGKNKAVGFIKNAPIKNSAFNRDKLLDDIRGGVRLRRVKTDDRSQAPAGKVMTAPNSSNSGATQRQTGRRPSQEDRSSFERSPPPQSTPKSNFDKELVSKLESKRIEANIPTRIRNEAVYAPIGPKHVQKTSVVLAPVAPPAPPAPPPPPVALAPAPAPVRIPVAYLDRRYSNSPSISDDDLPDPPVSPKGMSSRQLVEELRYKAEEKHVLQNNISTGVPVIHPNPPVGHLVRQTSNGEYRQHTQWSKNNATMPAQQYEAEFNGNNQPKVVSTSRMFGRKASSQEPAEPLANNSLTSNHHYRSYSMPPEADNFRDVHNGIVSQMLARLRQTDCRQSQTDASPTNQTSQTMLLASQSEDELTHVYEAAKDNFGCYIESSYLNQCYNNNNNNNNNNGIGDTTSAAAARKLRILSSPNLLMDVDSSPNSRSSLSSPSDNELSRPDCPKLQRFTPVEGQTRPQPFRTSGILPSVSALKKSFESNAQHCHNHHNHSPAKRMNMSGDQRPNQTYSKPEPYYNTPATSESGFHEDDESSIISAPSSSPPVQSSYRPAYEELATLPKVNKLKQNYEAKLQNSDSDSEGPTRGRGQSLNNGQGTNANNVHQSPFHQNNAQSVRGNHTLRSTAVLVRPSISNAAGVNSQSMLNNSEAKAKNSTPITYHASKAENGNDISRIEYMSVDDVRKHYIFEIDTNSSEVLKIVGR